MKDWKKKEEIVAAIEQLISPDSVVELDIHLPVLTSPSGSKRQCDIVIKNGKPPRQTISIVEVQDRTSKVDINTFDGWCTKMRDVGAQHLICVSKAGYPKSIIEKAGQIGPSVRLIELERIMDHKQTLSFISNVLKNPQREIVAVNNVELRYEHTSNTPKVGLTIGMNEKLFEVNGERITPFQLYFGYLDYLESRGSSYVDGKHVVKFSFPHPEQEFKILIESEMKTVTKFTGEIEFIMTNREFPFDTCRYTQIDYGEDIAWLMEATAMQNGEEKSLKVVIVQDELGNYTLGSRLF